LASCYRKPINEQLVFSGLKNKRKKKSTPEFSVIIMERLRAENHLLTILEKRRFFEGKNHAVYHRHFIIPKVFGMTRSAWAKAS
jgi:hypothetical protein